MHKILKVYDSHLLISYGLLDWLTLDVLWDIFDNYKMPCNEAEGRVKAC